MPRPLSDALCGMIKSDLQRGCDLETLKSRHRISDNKARSMMKNFRETGEVFNTNKSRKSNSGRPAKIKEEHIERLKQFLAEHPEAYLKDMTLFMEIEFGLELAESTLQRCCKRIGWSLKRQPQPRDELGSWARTLPRDGNGNPVRGVGPKKKRSENWGKKFTYGARKQLFEKTRQFVKDHMSQPRFDASHDYNHILRVVALSMEILRVEQNTFRKIMFDPIIVELVALIHDIDDHKYRPPINQTDGYPSPPSNLDPHSQQIPYDIGPSNPAHDQQTQTIPNLDPSLQTPAPSVVEAHLLELGWPTVYASKAAAITPYVSYTAEATNAPGYASALANYPELAVVQDADRLDAIGATGIGRAFTYGGAKGKEGGMPETMEHFEEKLIKLEAMMKTGEGQRLSVARAERVRIFGRWWHEEMRMVGMAGEGGFEWTQGTSPWASVGVPKGDPVEPGPASKEADIRPPNPDNQAVSGVQPPDGGAAPQVAAQNGDADNMEDVSQANGGQGEAGQQDPGAQLMEAIERSM